MKEQPPTRLDAESVLHQLTQFEAEARNRGVATTTFRHLTEVLNLDGSQRDDLRQLLINSRTEQYTAPLWRIQRQIRLVGAGGSHSHDRPLLLAMASSGLRSFAPRDHEHGAVGVREVCRYHELQLGPRRHLPPILDGAGWTIATALRDSAGRNAHLVSTGVPKVAQHVRSFRTSSTNREADRRILDACAPGVNRLGRTNTNQYSYDSCGQLSPSHKAKLPSVHPSLRVVRRTRTGPLRPTSQGNRDRTHPKRP